MQLAILALLAATMICCVMLIGRRTVYGEWKLLFLLWNLVLAWIPLVCAIPIYALRAGRVHRPWLLAFCAAIWFFFYPNAPYLITDLVHLKTRPPVPRWYDLITLMSFAWTGVLLGNLSLYLLQEVIRAWRGRAASWCFAIAMLALGALGVFVGRFWRWNSWQPFLQPLELASDAISRLRAMGLTELGLFSGTFFAFSLMTYITVYTLTHLHGYVDVKPDDPAKSRLPSPPL